MPKQLCLEQTLATARLYYRTEVLAPKEVAIIEAATAALQASDALDGVLSVGEHAPDFILPDADGSCVRLYGELEAAPVVLVFYRGGWCPYCKLYLRSLQDLLPKLEEAGGRLLAVSPQLPDHSLATRDRSELRFPLLCDIGNHVAQRYGLAFEPPYDLLALYAQLGHELKSVNGAAGSRMLPMPAVFLIGRDRQVVYGQAQTDYTFRSDPEEVLEELKNITEKPNH